MPTLQWTGKDQVIRHHLEVPVKILNKINDLSFKSKDLDESHRTENKIIQGDNLEVLKALMPEYRNKIKCIYIDPPYNTGNESWVYNDNVNDPKIQQWLNKVVDKDDLNRHSKWLCMMYPRLKLMRELLSDDGVIFISIDDNEQANLKLICDEIFGINNFINQFIWKKKQGGGNDSKHIVIEHEYILFYAKNLESLTVLLDSEHELDDNLYPFKDEKGEYGLVTLDKSSIRFSESLVFEIIDPKGNIYKPRIVKGKQSCWRWGKDKVQKDYDQLVFKNDKVYTKYYRPLGITPKSLLVDSRFGRTESGKDDIKKIFSDAVFDYPKPLQLIQHLLRISTSKNDIILDAFAGSGTTAHAVLNLNQEDNGNRKFILIEMQEYANSITAERVRRVMNSLEYPNETQKSESSTKPATANLFDDADDDIVLLNHDDSEIDQTPIQDLAFDFYELGQPYFDDIGNLNQGVSFEALKYYLQKMYFLKYYHINYENSYYIGTDEHHNDYYLIYDEHQKLLISYEFFQSIKDHQSKNGYKIFALGNQVPEDQLQKVKAEFCKIPSDIKKF